MLGAATVVCGSRKELPFGISKPEPLQELCLAISRHPKLSFLEGAKVQSSPMTLQKLGLGSDRAQHGKRLSEALDGQRDFIALARRGAVFRH